ncbi:hypothetical protein Scep_028231 [Stephania cephalantha]|uniref:Uncharacterized protein n=1 Tax=Stephania cephalantha TaxID=152367 RepID=A0AAP0E9J2_9MAGN
MKYIRVTSLFNTKYNDTLHHRRSSSSKSFLVTIVSIFLSRWVALMILRDPQIFHVQAFAFVLLQIVDS